MKAKVDIQKMVLSGLFLGLGLVLPFVTMHIPQVGNMLCPMHIPVLLCGFICGAPYGLIVGFITPLLRGMIFGMPVVLPVGICMAFELATYGIVAGFISKKFKETMVNTYITLIISMIVGRMVWGLAAALIYPLLGMGFSVQQFIMAGFVNAIPGIIVQLIIIPALVQRLRAFNGANVTLRGKMDAAR